MRSYKVLVFKSSAGSTAPTALLSTVSADFTLGSSRLADAPTIRSPIVRPLDGRTESNPWYVDVLDVGSSFSAQLADSTGRYDLLGRLVQVRRIDAATTTKLGTGRITDIALNEDVASYRVMAEDERSRERRTSIFTTNTTHLWPAGPHAQYGPFPPAYRAGYTLRAATAGAKWRFCQISRPLAPLTDSALALIQGDVIANPSILTASTVTGNFTNLRVTLAGGEYPVRNFPMPLDVGYLVGRATPYEYNDEQPPTAALDDPEMRQGMLGGQHFALWVGAPAAAANSGLGYLHMMGAPPTEDMPLHIGGADGITPQAMVVAVYNNTYCSSESALPRYSTAALDALPKTPPLRFRITQSADRGEWVEENVYRPYGLAPITDADGRIAPVELWWPGSTSVVVHTLTGANLAIHPSWLHPSREQVTKITFRYEIEGADIPPGTSLPERIQLVSRYRRGGDQVVMTEGRREFTHDRVSQFGVSNIELLAPGWHGVFLPTQWFGEHNVAVRAGESYAHEVFNRFGDGPVYGTLVGLSTAEGVNPGEWVKITLGTYPNSYVGGRGGSRIVQILSRTDTPSGPEFEYLDGGPALAPLAAPTITLSTSANDPRHQLRVTLADVVGLAKVQMAKSTAQPSETSSLWLDQYWEDSTGITNVNERASGTKYWARGRNQYTGRVNSSWTVSTGKTTQSLSAPTSLASTGISANRFTGVWRPSTLNVSYPLETFIDSATSAAFGSANRAARLLPGTRRYAFDGLASTTTYAWGVRHYDIYGGVSTAPRATVSTSSSATVCPSLRGLSIVYGLA